MLRFYEVSVDQDDYDIVITHSTYDEVKEDYTTQRVRLPPHQAKIVAHEILSLADLIIADGGE